MEKRKNTGLIILIVILSLLVIILGGVIIYDKVLTTNLNIEPENKVDNNEETNVNYNISVEDSVNYIDSYYKKFSVKLPKIIGETDKINEINTKILNDILPRTYDYPICYTENPDYCVDKGTSVDYKYIIKDDILIIYIYASVPEGGHAVPASGDGLIHKNYFYDIKNDSLLTLSEAAEKLNITDLDGANSYDDLIDNCSWMRIEDDELSIYYNAGCI